MDEYVAIYFFVVLLCFAFAYAITLFTPPTSLLDAIKRASNGLVSTAIAVSAVNFISHGLVFADWNGIEVVAASLVAGLMMIAFSWYYLRRQNVEREA